MTRHSGLDRRRDGRLFGYGPSESHTWSGTPSGMMSRGKRRLRRFRRRIKDGVYRVLHTLTGPGSGVRVILLYHSVGTDELHSIPPSIFAEQMSILSRRFHTVRLCDLKDALTSMPIDANLACVTFDDGLRDNYEYALRILEDCGIKGTFFVVSGLLGQSPSSPVGRRPRMTPAQVLECSSMGHEIGAHTVNHLKLTDVPLETARQEINDSKRSLEDLLGAAVESFAYPRGAYTDATRHLVASLGFKFAATTREGLVEQAPDWLALPRVPITDDLDRAAFTARVSVATGVFDRLRRARSRARSFIARRDMR
jgi:peptidoglycan/xylan/chitin deacetylase (PgdA/CDA1 family)